MVVTVNGLVSSAKSLNYKVRTVQKLFFGRGTGEVNALEAVRRNWQFIKRSAKFSFVDCTPILSQYKGILLVSAQNMVYGCAYL